jgi:hypothetical protein
MRHGVGLFGLVCSAIIIAIAARYGYKTSDSDFDGYIWAFIYGAITFAGLFGHMVAVRLWRRYRMRWLSAAVFIVCILTLVISLSNSIGAMAGRMNTTQAARVQTAETVRIARRDLKRVQDERDAMKFTAADDIALRAAQDKRDTAITTAKAECKDVRGSRCEAREKEERAAINALTEVAANKAATDHARELDTQIEKLTAKIAEKPVLEANSQGSALARLFGLPDDKADRMSTYQNLGMGVVLELLVAFSLIIFELMTESERLQKPARSFAPAPPAARQIEPEPEAPALIAAPVIEPEKPEPDATEAEEEPKAFPMPNRPRLIASRPDPIGSVHEILVEILEMGGRGRAEIRAIFNAYSEACFAQGKRPVPENEFPFALAAFCKATGIKTEITDKGAYLLNVRLKKSAKAEGGAL